MGNNEIPKQHNKIVDSRRVVPSNMLDQRQFEFSICRGTTSRIANAQSWFFPSHHLLLVPPTQGYGVIKEYLVNLK